jgi:hypothetical protein
MIHECVSLLTLSTTISISISLLAHNRISLLYFVVFTRSFHKLTSVQHLLILVYGPHIDTHLS